MFAPASAVVESDLAFFLQNGYVICRGLLPQSQISELQGIARQQLVDAQPPLELEAETGYPGAPTNPDAVGGQTIRRLLQATDRHPALRSAATQPRLSSVLTPLLGGKPVLAAAHHNCIMTKQPNWSSLTGWHQDIRYWSFERADLVSAWIALGEERPDNGCLWLIPGSHRWSLTTEQLDARQFFRDDLPDNQHLIAQRIPAELSAGDVLYFHCRTLHAADRNRTDAPKLSLVFTYRTADNLPSAGTRSDHPRDIALS